MAFLVFEGIDACGKSTLMSKLIQVLKRLNISYIQTREPGGTPLGDQLRELLIRKGDDHPVPGAELLLYEAIRCQHVEKVIRPALNQKRWVLCDRYVASTIAFQGVGRRIDPEVVLWLNHFATGGLQPDLTVLLDVSFETSQRRMQKRENDQGQPRDRFEDEERSFHEAVRESYLEQARSAPDRWLVLNGEQSPEAVFAEFGKHLKERAWLDF